MTQKHLWLLSKRLFLPLSCLFIVPPANIQVSGPIDPVQEGGNVSLTCIVNEGSSPEINWSKDQSPIDERKTVLHLIEVTAKDKGLYTCKAENEGGSSNDSIFVNVDSKW